MLTPQQLRRLGEILSQETPETTLDLRSYIKTALSGQSFPLGEYLRISPNGRIEASQPKGLKPYAQRLATRQIIRFLTQLALENYPIGIGTKEWYKEALKAKDFLTEAQNIYRNYECQKGNTS